MRGLATASALLIGAALWPAHAVGADGVAEPSAGIALFPTQNRAGDATVAAAAEQTLRFELSRHGRLIGPEPTRDALRRLRVRNGDQAPAEVLRLLGEELGADWLVSSTLHTAGRQRVPRLTISARIYAGATGELLWAGFKGGSGLDRRRLLGLGSVAEAERLAPHVVRAMLAEAPPSLRGEAKPRPPRSRHGRVALVPFAAATLRRGTAHAETVTEAARARLSADGIELLSPNSAHEALRRLQGGRWGGVTAETRAALGAHATLILTGAVEAFEMTGSELAPEPRAAVAMRLLDAASGRILWTGWLERGGSDGLHPLGLGRIHSLGALTEQIVRTLGRRLHEEAIRTGELPAGGP